MKNNRTFLEKLLDGAEVEWKPLSLVTEMQRGKTITAKSANEGKIPVISGGQKPAYYHSESNRDGKTITVAGSGAYAGYIMYWEEPIFVSDAFSIKTDESLLQIKYVYHFLLQNQQKIYAMKKGSGVPHVYPKDIGTLTIPIPPLSVQIEIVKILDALTALTSELTSELILRQKQYEYYREKLLSEEELGKVGFEWKPLKEIAEYIRGVTYNKTNESPNNIGYKILRANNITLSSNTLNFDDIKVIKFDTKVKSSQMLYKNDILISAASGSREHVGKVAFIYQDIDYYFGGFMGVIRCNNNVNSRYLFHIFTSSIFQDYLNEVLNSSTINNLNSKVMDSFRLPIPPLSVQTEIVKILDKFENLTNSITEGLPLAIEQSQKRYEYYRELLLNFPGRE